LKKQKGLLEKKGHPDTKKGVCVLITAGPNMKLCAGGGGGGGGGGGREGEKEEEEAQA
jgi:hypothetical protein